MNSVFVLTVDPKSNIVLLQEALPTYSQSNIAFLMCFLSYSTLFPVQLQSFKFVKIGNEPGVC